jgi:hypothetical protein
MSDVGSTRSHESDLPGIQCMRGDKLVGELPRRAVGHHHDVGDTPDPRAVGRAQPRVQATRCRPAYVDALGSRRASSEELPESLFGNPPESPRALLI